MAEELKVGVDKELMRRAFDRAAKTYDQAAVLQKEVGRRMLERLDLMKHTPMRILDAGCGTGTQTRALAQRYPHAEVLGLDLAPRMVATAQSQRSWWQRTLAPWTRNTPRYIAGDLESLPLASSSVNLLWSNFALQWSNDVGAAFKELYRVLAPNGLLMFSSLGPDTLRELRHAFAGLDGHTHVNRFVDMHDLGDLLSYAGFSAPVVDMEFFTLTYTDLNDLLAEIKALGAHNVSHGRQRGLMGKQRWQSMRQNYEKLRIDGRLPATYEVIYGHAWVGEKKPRATDGRQIIELKIQSRRAGLS